MATFIVAMVVAGMVALAIRSIRRDKKAGKSCGSCSGCGGSADCHVNQESKGE